ncbi:twin-arginine translocase TatA/TatE family subunit [Oceanibacterium hippocampi]|uniref:Sec-independent protein translocase protein TatA n=1 Tax=Oceanibacterium hippocampi TaxID=745714 RepID=A0A1Y5TZ89_9PROT|nr:twin-arginine translocase TatA/TatE family subunit [Oceanibacterium hippocampi]SLN77226.1 Sec-independent protein translocase protein TatA [Oceanibacterium hippocampi]
MSIGIWQIVLVLVIILIIFGAGKLPRVAGDLAKGIKNFKSGMADDSSDKPAAPAADQNGKTISASESADASLSEKDKAAQS